MESSVIKIENQNIKVIRLGSLSIDKIKNLLNKKLGMDFQINLIQKMDKDSKNQIAPGQFIKHYSSFLQSYKISKKYQNQTLTRNPIEENSYLIDFNGHLKTHKN